MCSLWNARCACLCFVRVRRRVLVEDVFVNESARVEDFLRESTAVLRTLYPPLSSFNATGLRMEGSLCNEVAQTPMRNFARGRDQTMPVLVELDGSGIDMGWPEVDTVRCTCGCVSSKLGSQHSCAQFNYAFFITPLTRLQHRLC
eukprot:COSAG02_NODE_3545_length_6583_cov_2.896823_3_plen_145_part_00